MRMGKSIPQSTTTRLMGSGIYGARIGAALHSEMMTFVGLCTQEQILAARHTSSSHVANLEAVVQ